MERSKEIHDILHNLNSNNLVVTPNQRLASYLLEQHENLQQHKQAWETPSIISLSHWLDQLYIYCAEQMSDFPRLLNSLQEQQLWQQILEQDEHVFLTDSWSLIKQLQQAWEFVQLWQISETELAEYFQEDYLWFLTLCQKFHELCISKNYLTQAQLPSFITEHISHLSKISCHKITLFAFDETSPSFQQLLTALTAFNIDIEYTNITKPAKSINAYAYTDSHAEITAMANWALLQYKSGKKNIACVVPNLMQNRKLINRIFNDVFFPKHYFGYQKLINPFTITGGHALLEQSTIQTVVAILNICRYQCDFDAINRLLLTPYLSSSISEQTPRALFAAFIREYVFIKTNLNTIIHYLTKYQDCPEMLKQLQIMQTFKASSSQKRNINKWIIAISTLLKALGWPGERTLSSHEFQQVSKFTETLNLLSDIDAFHEQISYEEFLDLLIQSLQQQLFQPQAKAAPVQILGLLEAAGQTFDAVWLMDLTNINWPANASPNPFLPVPLQRKYNLPHCSADKELDFALKMQNRLINSCDEMVLSWPETEGETHYSPSTLIIPYINQAPSLDNEIIQQEISVNLTPENYQLLPVIQEQFQADSSLIKKQAECPFQAFAHYRLKAKPLENITFQTNKKMRGILVHQVLQDFWQKHINLTQLKQFEKDLPHICHEQATQTVKKFYHTRGIYSEHFINLEINRIAQLLQNWLYIELERDDFSIYEIEKTHTLFIDKLKLRLRVDRVDQLHDGNLIIIDYKTGMVSERDWISEQFTEPQLPTYCLLFPNKVVALAFVSLKPDQMRFKGIAVESTELPGMHKQNDISKLINSFIEKYATQDITLTSSKTISMQEMYYLQQAWGNKINSVAQDFIQGNNLPQPINTQVCDFCLRQSLCRVYELREQQNRTIHD